MPLGKWKQKQHANHSTESATRRGVTTIAVLILRLVSVGNLRPDTLAGIRAPPPAQLILKMKPAALQVPVFAFAGAFLLEPPQVN
jgi:hypothetical protein